MIAGAQLGLLFFYYRQFQYKVLGRFVWGIADDIYISACYARNLAQGHDLVWFAGAPRVEGFSNPLWVFLLALLHRLPGFHERRLGLFIIGLNSLILIANLLVLRAIWERLSSKPESGAALTPSRRNGLLCLIFALNLSFPYWLSEGFEVGLVLLLTLSALALVLREPLSKRNLTLVGVLAGLAFLTRMDGVLLFAAPGVPVLFGPGPWGERLRRVARLGAVAAVIMAAGLLARRAYYHDWLPNTYYLKIYGWPLGDRLRLGLRQNGSLFLLVLLAWAPLLWPDLRRRLGRELPLVAALLATFTLTVLYSTQNGGDSWLRKAGFDRFEVPGSMLLLLALGIMVARLSRRWFPVGLAYVFLLVFLPIATEPHFIDFWRNIQKRKKPPLEMAWTQAGLTYKKVSSPGARMAICPAGAIIYFSHRGGVDMYGKCEPLVARRPVNLPGLSGHNKRYDLDLYKVALPDFSRYPVPKELSASYIHMIHKAGPPSKSDHFWVRKDSPLVNWKKLIPVKE